MFVDSHCHLNYLKSSPDALARARSGGVGGMLCIGVDEAGIDEVLAIAKANDDVWASVGLHPQSAEQDLSWIEGKLCACDDVVAVGETGLDYKTAVEVSEQHRQLAAFEHQMQLAQQYGLPVVIHTRDAEQDTLAMLERYPDVQGVLHCFTESWGMAEKALAMGYYISISGIVTFANAENVRIVARQVPEDRLLIETDAPWLAPVPYRGKENEPAFVAETAKLIAQLRDESLEELAAYTSENFRRLFLSADVEQKNSKSL
jgi:TatD DNase family protein